MYSAIGIVGPIRIFILQILKTGWHDRIMELSKEIEINNREQMLDTTNPNSIYEWYWRRECLMVEGRIRPGTLYQEAIMSVFNFQIIYIIFMSLYCLINFVFTSETVLNPFLLLSMTFFGMVITPAFIKLARLLLGMVFAEWQARRLRILANYQLMLLN